MICDSCGHVVDDGISDVQRPEKRARDEKIRRRATVGAVSNGFFVLFNHNIMITKNYEFYCTPILIIDIVLQCYVLSCTESVVTNVHRPRAWQLILV